MGEKLLTKPGTAELSQPAREPAKAKYPKALRKPETKQKSKKERGPPTNIAKPLRKTQTKQTNQRVHILRGIPPGSPISP